jgi:hypothetical protein
MYGTNGIKELHGVVTSYKAKFVKEVTPAEM